MHEHGHGADPSHLVAAHQAGAPILPEGALPLAEVPDPPRMDQHKMVDRVLVPQEQALHRGGNIEGLFVVHKEPDIDCGEDTEKDTQL